MRALASLTDGLGSLWPWHPPCSADERERRAALRLLRRHQRMLRDVRSERDSLLRQIARDTRSLDSRHLRRSSERLARRINLLRVLEALQLDGDVPADQIVISSWMLRDSFRLCTESSDEGMHFIAGIEVEGMAIATRIILFPYVHRSIAAAVGDHQATHRICIDAHEAGHHLLALIHSHPGSGPHANHPSGEDMRTQRLWERTTRMVGGIWSRDGHLRFFSADRPITVKVVGHQMEQIDENLHRLVQAETPVEMQAPEAGL